MGEAYQARMAATGLYRRIRASAEQAVRPIGLDQSRKSGGRFSVIPARAQPKSEQGVTAGVAGPMTSALWACARRSVTPWCGVMAWAGTDPGGASAPCRDLAADAVCVRARAEVPDGCDLCPAPFRGGMGAGGAAARVIHPAAVSSRKANMGAGSPAATGRGTRPRDGRAAIAPQLVGTRTRIR